MTTFNRDQLSDWLHDFLPEEMHERFVVHSVHSKTRILNIDNHKIEKYGVVSAEIAKEMSIGVKNKFESDISISVSGNVGLKS